MRWIALAAFLATPAAALETVEDLGEALFFDVNLSKNRSQSCASCHDPEAAFTDPRGPVSLGDDGASLGDRTAPTAMYAWMTPPFEQLDETAWRGGMFWDGRAADLAEQAGGPPLNPIEMGMPDKASVVARLRENPDYVSAFAAHYGDEIWEDTEAAYAAMTQAIAAFERTEQFAPFTSKYDRFLRGEVQLTRLEEMGRHLFFSPMATNCHLCHQLNVSPVAAQEPFTNFEYHNIGVPVNEVVRDQNGVTGVDWGLVSHPDVKNPRAGGRFKTPTLRNIAVTAPYMHNGVFQDLRTVIQFYNKYTTTDPAFQVNPETGETWRRPEIPMTLSVAELTEGFTLNPHQIDALVAFLKTLTDARYEHLLEE